MSAAGATLDSRAGKAWWAGQRWRYRSDEEAAAAYRRLAEDASRPVLLYSRFASCMQPSVKGLVTMTNSRFNGWRMEDVWLDQ